MNYLLILILLFFFGTLAYFLIKNLLIRAPIPQSRTDDHEEELYFRTIDSLSEKHRIIQLFLSCKSLANKDVFSISDPQVEVYEREGESEPWKKVGETEIVTNDLNPFFTKGVVLHYFTNKNQLLRFLVKDIDINIQANTLTFDLIGEYCCSFNDLIVGGENGVTANLVGKRGGVGEISIIAETVVDFEASNEGKKSIIHFNEVSVKGLAVGLPTYFQIFRFSGSKQILCYQSEVQQSSFNPKWKSFNIHKRNPEEPVLIRLHKWSGSAYGGDALIGEAKTSISVITSNNNTTCEILNNGKVTATLVIQYCRVEKKPINDFHTVSRYGFYTKYLNRFTFRDYYSNGLELQTLCAIDMTKASTIFHQSQNGAVPVVEQVLSNILSIIEPLDRDRSYALYGFGAKNPKGVTQPLFPLNGSDELVGVQQAISCYKTNYPQYEPASVSEADGKFKANDFYPIVQTVLDQCAEGRTAGWLTRKYFIIFVLIAGDQIDSEETIKHIVEATNCPISVVLIAMGKSQDFPKNSQLDADDSPLVTKGKVKSKRDIVQFVNIDPARLKNQQISRDYLEREILAELPAQVCSYMSMNFITPRNI